MKQCFSNLAPEMFITKELKWHLLCFNKQQLLYGKVNPNFLITVESRFLEPSLSGTSRYFEPNLVSLGFASIKLYNFTPDFSANPRFLETPDNSNQIWLRWDKLTLDNSNLRKFLNHLKRMSITFKPLNKLDLDNLRKSTRNISQIILRPEFLGCKGVTTYYKLLQLN